MVKNVPGAGVHKPRDVIVDQFLAPVRGLFEDGDPKVKVNNIFCKGSLVCAETRALGKMKNGNTYDNLYCWVVEVRDGLIYALREYMDSAYIQSIV
jgi:ketosteroid isomerase-like protein